MRVIRVDVDDVAGWGNWRPYVDPADVITMILRESKEAVDLGFYPPEVLDYCRHIVGSILDRLAVGINELQTDAEKAKMMYEAHADTPWLARLMSATVLASSEDEMDEIVARSIQDFREQEEA